MLLALGRLYQRAEKDSNKREICSSSEGRQWVFNWEPTTFADALKRKTFLPISRFRGSPLKMSQLRTSVQNSTCPRAAAVTATALYDSTFPQNVHAPPVRTTSVQEIPYITSANFLGSLTIPPWSALSNCYRAQLKCRPQVW